MLGAVPEMTPPVHWGRLPALPDREGFAAPFAGVSGGSLLVAGGANFPERRPWDGGTKTWYDTVYVLDPHGQAWAVAGRLPQPNAYGVSVTFGGRLVCIGGGNAEVHYRTVQALGWDGHTLSIEALPPLPRPCAFMSGALIGSTVYVAGGIEKPDAVSAIGSFYRLDLASPKSGWESLPTWPGPARAQAVAAASGGKFYLLSGHDLHPGPDGKPLRTYFSDAYAYTPGQGWKRLHDLPHPAAAAPTPAPVNAGGLIFVLTGDDGKRLALNGPNHPGFQRDLLIYDPGADRWQSEGEMPFSRVTVPTARWGDRWIIPNGERMPGIRSNEVWSLSF